MRLAAEPEREDVMAPVGPDGTIAEHFTYSPYGIAKVMNADDAPTDGNDFVYLFQGDGIDANTELHHFAARDYSPTLGRWTEQDPAGYVDGMNDYQFVSDDPVGLIDPLGLDGATTQPTTQSNTATVDLTIDTGSTNQDQPWVGATWTRYKGVPNDNKGNPGLVRIGLPSVASSTDVCKVKFKVSIKLQIELRNTADKKVIENIDGKLVLTALGRQVYGHEQLHVKDFVTSLQTLVDGIVQSIPNGVDAADAIKKAAEGKRELQKALDAWRNARLPGGKGPDITHGGPGQPVSGVGNDPDGEPGPYVPS